MKLDSIKEARTCQNHENRLKPASDHEPWPVYGRVLDSSGTDRRLVCMDDDVIVQTKAGEELRIAQRLLPDTPWVPVPTTLPGATVRISVRLTAPDVPGSMLSYWKLAHSDGSLCFPNSRGVWVKVHVTTLLAAE